MEIISKLKEKVLRTNPHLELIVLDNHTQKEMDAIEEGCFIVYNHMRELFELHAIGSLLQSHEDNLVYSYQTSFENLEFDIPKWMYQNSMAIFDATDMLDEMSEHEEAWKAHEEQERKQFGNYMHQIAIDNLHL